MLTAKQLRVGFSCALVGLLFAAASTVVAAPPEGKRYAVLVAVQKYDDATLKPLKYSEKDIGVVADQLRPKGYEIVLLSETTGKDDPALEPTKANIEKQLTMILDKCTRNDLVLVAFVGHGVQSAGLKTPCLCPQDALLEAGKEETLIPLTWVYKQLDDCGASAKLLLLDACRIPPQGGQPRGVDGGGLDAPPKGVFAFFSCSPGETAFEHADLKQGVFFHSILDGLAGKAADEEGLVTIESLAMFVRKDVPKQVDQLKKDAKQTPVLRLRQVSGASPVLLSMLDEKRIDQMAAVVKAVYESRLAELPDEDTLKPHIQEQLTHWRQAAEWSSPHGQYLYGECLHRGIGVNKDAVEAAKWLRKAAAQGHAPAQGQLGRFLEKGWGVTQNDAEAVQWYRKAAEQGHALAQNYLGDMLYEGKGIGQDDAEAVRWYRQASDAGYVPAHANLALMLEKGRGIEKNETKAAALYRLAANKGNSWAQNRLANLYYDGRGVTRDLKEAARWFRKAAEQGQVRAQAYLAYMLTHGQGVTRDDAEALTWYRKASAQGSATASYNLGWMYETGRGVTSDTPTAIKWYRQAATLGDDDAPKALQRLNAGR